MKKVALNLSSASYQKLQSRLYHGQMTQIFNRFIKSLNFKISEEGKAELNAWIDGEVNLVIPKDEEEEPSDE